MCLRRKKKEELERARQQTAEAAMLREQAHRTREAAERTADIAASIADRQRVNLELNGFGEALLTAMRRRGM